MARRITALAPAPASSLSLEDYPGTYRGEELLAEYRIELKEGTLVVRHPRHDDAPLEHVKGDDFGLHGAASGSVHFTREANGRVKGLRMTTGRVWNLEFVRVRGAETRRFCGFPGRSWPSLAPPPTRFEDRNGA